jgi:hypothetical protein
MPDVSIYCNWATAQAEHTRQTNYQLLLGTLHKKTQ